MATSDNYQQTMVSNLKFNSKPNNLHHIILYSPCTLQRNEINYSLHHITLNHGFFVCYHGVLRYPQIIYLHTPIFGLSSKVNSSSAILKTTIGTWLPFASSCCPFLQFCCPLECLSLLWQYLLLGLQMQETLHDNFSYSCSILFSFLQNGLGKVLNDASKTMLPHVHSNCSGGKFYLTYVDFFTCPPSLFSPEFVDCLEKHYFHPSYERNISPCTWLASPNKKSHNGLSFHKINMIMNTNNQHFYGLYYCNSDKSGIPYLIYIYWSSFSFNG